MTVRNSNFLAVLTIVVASTFFAIAYPRVCDLMEDRSLNQCKLNLKQIGRVLLAYRDMNFPEIMPPELNCLVPLFLKELPRCPSHPGLDYQYFRGDYQNFVLACPGRHKKLMLGYPRIMASSKAFYDNQQEFAKDYPYKKDRLPGSVLPTKAYDDTSGFPFKLNSFSARGEGVAPEFQHIVDDPSVPRAPNP